SRRATRRPAWEAHADPAQDRAGPGRGGAGRDCRRPVGQLHRRTDLHQHDRRTQRGRRSPLRRRSRWPLRQAAIRKVDRRPERHGRTAGWRPARGRRRRHLQRRRRSRQEPRRREPDPVLYGNGLSRSRPDRRERRGDPGPACQARWMSDHRHHVGAARAEGVGYTIVENASLDGRNTFRVAARANLLIDVRRADALHELFGFAMLKSQPLLVLGAGSNILFTRDWPGIVLSMAAHATRGLEDDGETATLRVEAGESWNAFVHWSLAHGFCGLENLVLIPGTVGAAPIQNIGAYGTEVGEFISTVEVWDRTAGAIRRLSRGECRFGYRDSVFKQERDRYIVIAVEFVLSRSHPLRMDYAG